MKIPNFIWSHLGFDLDVPEVSPGFSGKPGLLVSTFWEASLRTAAASVPSRLMPQGKADFGTVTYL